MLLPVQDVLEDLKSALDQGPNAVLVAPPGAGKTTGAAPALLSCAWRTDSDKIVMLLPRRLAVRAAASRIAEEMGCSVGGMVGYRVRMEVRVGPQTRLELMTPGVFLRQLHSDPELTGVAGVIFDEVHERGLDMDLCLAFCIDVQAGLRPDLRLLAMSATIDAQKFSSVLGNAPIVVSDGRLFPVDTQWLPPRDGERLDRHVARAVVTALQSGDTGEAANDVLVFLPGLREIRQAEQALDEMAGRWPNVDVLPLHGGLELAEQARALKPSVAGRRKVVLATAIAETSVTLPGIRTVIDSGLARIPRHEPELRLSRLETSDASRATIEQRRGRAGRVQAGTCIRLWHEGTTRARPAQPPAEVLNTDLTGFMLHLAAWGITGPEQLTLLDQPAEHSVRLARDYLASIGALDGDGRITGHGRALMDFGLSPDLATMIIEASKIGLALTASLVAGVLSETGASSTTDLRARVDALTSGRYHNHKAIMAQARGWAKATGAALEPVDIDQIGLCLALGMPDRVAKRRETVGTWQMANGRSVQLDPTAPLAVHDWLVVADLQGSAKAARLMAAAPVCFTTLEQHLSRWFMQADEVRFDPATGGLVARHVRRFGAITVLSQPSAVKSGHEAEQALLDAVRAGSLSLLPWTPSAMNRRARLAWLESQQPGSWPDQSDEALLASLDDWLAPEIAGKTSFNGLELGAALENRVAWQARSSLATLAPLTWTAPSGRVCTIDYAGSDLGPQVEVGAKDLYGLDQHPTILNGGHRLLLALTSPAQRPIALTSDLPSFWRGGWLDARKDMRARYPKHDWAEQPWLATPPKPRERKS